MRVVDSDAIFVSSRLLEPGVLSYSAVALVSCTAGPEQTTTRHHRQTAIAGWSSSRACRPAPWARIGRIDGSNRWPVARINSCRRLGRQT